MNYKITITPAEEAPEQMKSVAGEKECDSFVLLTFNEGRPSDRVYGGVTIGMIGRMIAQEDLLIRGAKYADGIVAAEAIRDALVDYQPKSEEKDESDSGVSE